MGLQVNDAGFVVTDLIKAIVAQRDRLSEIDGAIGDGDHGVRVAQPSYGALRNNHHDDPAICERNGVTAREQLVLRAVCGCLRIRDDGLPLIFGNR